MRLPTTAFMRSSGATFRIPPDDHKATSWRSVSHLFISLTVQVASADLCSAVSHSVCWSRAFSVAMCLDVHVIQEFFITAPPNLSSYPQLLDQSSYLLDLDSCFFFGFTKLYSTVYCFLFLIQWFLSS